MDETAVLAQPRPRHLEIWLPLVVVALDQATKALVRAKVPLHESVTILPA